MHSVEPTLPGNDLHAEALLTFRELLDAARVAGDPEPTAMTLATSDGAGRVSARTVLLKAADERGFVFYTNFESHKGQEILGSMKAAMCFHWKTLRRQVRVRGPVEIVSNEEADEYY